MTVGTIRRGRLDGDPVGSEKARGKNRERRKGRFDGKSWTATESRMRDQLMKQFCRLEGPSGNSEAYINSPIWCEYPGCHRMNGTHKHLAQPKLEKQLENAAITPWGPPEAANAGRSMLKRRR